MNTEYIYDFDNLSKEMQIYYYEQLRERLYSIAYYLDRGSSALNGINSIITKDYNIDGTIPANIKLNSINDNINSRSNYIYYTILPAINSKIDSLR